MAYDESSMVGKHGGHTKIMVCRHGICEVACNF